MSKYITLLVLSTLALAFAVWIATRSQPAVPSPVPEREVPPPDISAVETFLNAPLYFDKLAGLVTGHALTLSRFANSWQLKLSRKVEEVKPPIWKTGERTATVPVVLAEFPEPGSSGIASLRLDLTPEGWKLNLFASEPQRLQLVANVMEHPVGVLLAYYNCPETALRTNYVLEEALSGDRIAVSTGQNGPLPFVEFSLADIKSVDINPPDATAMAVLVFGTEETSNAVFKFRSVGRWWYIWRKGTMAP